LAEEEHLEQAAQASFTPVHERLMDAIAASRDSSVRKPGKFGWPAIFRMEARGRTLLAHCALAFIVVFAAASGGHYVGYHRNTTALPVQSIIDDYHAGLRNPLPYEFVADDPATAAAWLSRQLGMKVHLPSPKQAGIKLLGARHHRLHGHPVAQTHYLKNGTHVALYQIHAPRYGLGDLDEVEIKGHLYYIKNSGLCNMVIWRVDDNVMAMVSPFAMRESLLLAQAMRTNSRALPEYA
jgi:anti-sigma factor RsiW